MIDLDHLAHVRPSRRQYEWQKTEFYGFVHFGMNTMTGREWGTGREDPALFDPGDVDTDAWVRALASAGMGGVILTAKHHDGFCLWPSRYTDHSVAASPWRDGGGDLVGELADSCARHGMKLGVYVSPWDKHAPSYGRGRPYDDVFVGQLVELLTGYGEIFSLWLDGANGEGPNGRRQEYGWDRYYRTVRALQPEAVISVCGPDVRWCGNEAGHTRPEEWSVVPRALQDAERSQQVDDGTFARLVRSDDQDLGSRSALTAACGAGDLVGELVWYPAEVNTSLRPGWFHHPTEDQQVRSDEELFEIYRRSVGGNSTFLLNVPPTREGRIADADRAALRGLGELIQRWRAAALEVTAIRFSTGSGITDLAALSRLDNDRGWWEPAADDETPWVDVEFGVERHVSSVVLKEQITVGQRIERAQILRYDSGSWVPVATIGSVGYQRIVSFPPVRTSRLRVRITASRRTPTLAAVVPVAAT